LRAPDGTHKCVPRYEAFQAWICIAALVLQHWIERQPVRLASGGDGQLWQVSMQARLLA